MSSTLTTDPHAAPAPGVHSPAAAAAAFEAPVLVALLAEYETVDEVIAAAKQVRAAGFRRWDVHSPFPIHGIDGVMGVRPTILPWLVLGAGLFGLGGGIWMQWYANAHDYQFLLSGKPIWSLPANIPVAFETTVLCASLTAVFGMLGLNKLPMLFNPVFKSERFRRVTNDRFFVVIDATDPAFDDEGTEKLLRETGSKAIERVED